MHEVLRYATQPVEIPAGVTGITEKDAAHIIVDAVDLMALAFEVFHGFRANQPAGSGNKNRLRLHLMESAILQEGTSHFANFQLSFCGFRGMVINDSERS